MDELRISQIRRLRALLAKKEALTREEESEKEQLLTELSITLGLPESEIIEQAVVPELATSGALEPAILAFLMGEREAALSAELEKSTSHLTDEQWNNLILLLVKKAREKNQLILNQALENQKQVQAEIGSFIGSGKPGFNLNQNTYDNAQDLVNNYLTNTGEKLTHVQENQAVQEVATNLVLVSQYTVTPRHKEEKETTGTDISGPAVSPEEFGAALKEDQRPAEKQTQMVKKTPVTTPEPELVDELLVGAPITEYLTVDKIALLTELAVNRATQNQTPLLKLDQQLDEIFSVVTPEKTLEFTEQTIAGVEAQSQGKPAPEPKLALEPSAYHVLDLAEFEKIVNDVGFLDAALPTTQTKAKELSSKIVSKPYQEGDLVDQNNDPLIRKINSDRQANLDTIESLVKSSAAAQVVLDLITPNKDAQDRIEESLRKRVVEEVDDTASLLPPPQAAFVGYLSGQLAQAPTPAIANVMGLSQKVDPLKLLTIVQKELRNERALETSQIRELNRLVRDLGKVTDNYQNDVRPQSTGFGALRRFQNTSAKYLPPWARPALSPVSSIQNGFARVRATNFITRYNLSPAAARWAGQNLSRLGVSGISKVLTQRALTMGGRLAALKALALTLPGGPLLSAAIEVGSQLLKQGGKIFNGFAKAIWGDKVRKIDLAGAMGLAGASVMSGFTALGVGASAAMASIFAAAGSAFMTLFIAAAGTFIFYIAALNIAPILSTLVHLESGLGVAGTAGVSGIPEGLELRSCWPVDGSITQLNTPAHLVYTRLGSRGTALDIGASHGDPVYAPVSGTMNYYSMGTGPLTSGAGNYIIIEGPGVTIALLHLSGRSNIGNGSEVAAGNSLVGYVGNTGNSFGPHVHYEVWGANIDLIVPRRPTLFMSVAHTECTDIVGGGDGSRVPGEPAVNCPDDGERIQYPGATVNYLTNRTSENGCVTPQQLVIHWSGGDPYESTAADTRGTLQKRDSGCAFAVDWNGVIQMMPLYGDKVQEGICSHQNNISIDIEISGRCFSTDNATCGGGTATPPENHPTQGAQFMNNVVNLARWIMNQYNIPCSGIRGHFETAPGLRDDPGRNWLNNSLKPRLGC